MGRAAVAQRWIGLWLATAMATVSLVTIAASPASADTTEATPVGRVLVVTANLQEAFGTRDVRDSSDMDVFVRRITSNLPYAPDALLLQEVRHDSASYVARKLSERTGWRYVVRVDPGNNPWVETRRHIVKKETAIVLNSGTMTALGSGGFVATSYSRSEGISGRKPEVKNQAHLLVREIGSELTVPLASVHLSRLEVLASKAASDSLRAEWMQKVATFLRNRYGSVRPITFGGDVNSGKCLNSSSHHCEQAPFWAALTGQTLRYRDSVDTVTYAPGVDYVFTKGGIYDARIDSTYHPQAVMGQRARYYSDHAYRWALIGRDVTPPSAPSGLSRDCDRAGHVQLGWSPATDEGGSGGIDRYEVWRAGQSMDFHAVTTTAPDVTSFVDGNTYTSKTYNYYVVAYDRAYNSSPSTQTVNIVCRK